MDVIALVKEGCQSVAEHAASYKMGQTVLRHFDKALWVVEKCARWAVPPPLDPEDRPQPELVRPLPWVFFLVMLVTLRVTRESISLINLVLGKPPLRSADVVTYIQGKRRYLRTLKYQGNRMMRARTSSSHEPWYSGLRTLFEFTMCFRRQSMHYGNNNTTRVSNNDEVLVVKRSKRVRQDDSTAASTSEVSMERLIEKMMVDLDADSNDDSSYTLTNATSMKSDTTEDTADSDQESVHNDPQASTPQPDTHDASPSKSSPNSTNATNKPEENAPKATEGNKKLAKNVDDNGSQALTVDAPPPAPETPQNPKTCEELALSKTDNKKSPAMDSQALIQNEKPQRTPKKEQKMANGRTVKSTSERDIGERRESNLPVARAASADLSSRARKENVRQPQ